MIPRVVFSIAWLFVALLVHELGHAALGSLAGFRLALLGIGPVGVAKTATGLQLRWLPAASWGPFVSMRADFTDRVEWRTSWLLSGGPFVSLCVGAILVGAPYVGMGPRWMYEAGALNLCVAVATGQPVVGTGAGIPSDGRRLWDLWRGTTNARAAAALVVLEAQAAGGLRPAAWDAVLLRKAAQVTAPPAFTLAAAVATYRYVADRAGLAEAGAELASVRRLYGAVPQWLRGDAATEVAFWLASPAPDLPGARTVLADARGPLATPYRRWRSEAAVFLLDGNVLAADRALGEAERSLSQASTTPSAFDRMLVAATRKRLQDTRSNLHPQREHHDRRG